jgi:predicted nucleic acid-binding protein
MKNAPNGKKRINISRNTGEHCPAILIIKRNCPITGMSVMVILIDTNIILDYLTSRRPFMDNADKVVDLCFRQRCSGYIAAHSITNISYILRGQFSANERKKMLMELCEFVEVAGIQRKQVIDALVNEDFEDLEDRLQVECARMVNADYIVTRNIADFFASPIPAILPEDLFKKVTDT